MIKTLFNFIFAIYIVFSFIILIDIDWVISHCNENIANFLLQHSDEVYSIKYINFVFCYLISIVSFYAQGYKDGKKNLQSPTNETN